MQTKNNYKVYKHTFPNGKSYIGITMQTLEKRFGANGCGYKKCPKMHNAILKYGWNNVEHEMLYDGLSKPEAEAKEIEMIAFYDSVSNGYNTDHGGNVTGTHSIETRAKISAGNRGKKKPPMTDAKKQMYSAMFSGSDNPFYGHHHTDVTKKKHSEFMRGNSYNKGNHHSDEFKKMKSTQMHEKYINGGNPKCREVIMVDQDGNETRFYSLRKAAESLGKNIATLHKYVHTHKTYGGCTWRYVDE